MNENESLNRSQDDAKSDALREKKISIERVQKTSKAENKLENTTCTEDVISESNIAPCNRNSSFHSCTREITDWFLFAGLIILGLLLRWLQLGDRPYHHDESIHVMFGKYFYDFPSVNYYKYDPTYHGPLLYHILFLFFNTFGFSDYTARIPVVLMGTFILFMPYFFRSWFSKYTTLSLTAFVALSPTLIYWTRFLREDIVVLFAMCLSLWGIFRSKPTNKAFFLLLGITVHICSKENSFVHLAIFIGFYCYEILFNLWYFKAWSSSLSRLKPYIQNNLPSVVFSLFFCIALYCLLFTSFFQHGKGILDGLYRTSLGYWWSQHSVDRIAGPFLFHFYVLAWYEYLFLILFLIQTYLLYRYSSSLVPRALFIGSVLFCCALYLLLKKSGVENVSMLRLDGLLPASLLQLAFKDVALSDITVGRVLKIKDNLDIFAFVLLPVHALLLTSIHLMNKERILAITGYFFMSCFFTYSYLGEKVPWLTMYIYAGGIVYLAFYFDDFLKRNPIQEWRSFPASKLFMIVGVTFFVLSLLLIFTKESQYTSIFEFILTFNSNQDRSPIASYLFYGGLIFSLLSFASAELQIFEKVNIWILFVVIVIVVNTRCAIQTNFTKAGEASEYLSQVHTTREFKQLAYYIRETIETQRLGYRPRIYVAEEPVWPVTWYFRDLPEYNYTASEEERKAFKYFLVSDKVKSMPGYRTRMVNLRGWWVPDFNQMTLWKFIVYAINHEPWSPVGYQIVSFHERIGEEPGK
jgi:uncharacterized protein (TIGR03663 family)